jgi:nitrous oxidase accessory protein NosD
MNVSRRIASVFIGTAVVLAPAAPAAAAAAPVACGAVLSADTTLHADLTCTGTGLVIGADAITLNLGGHTLTGTGTGAGIDLTTRNNIAVKNGTVTGFAQDVKINDGSTFVTLTKVALPGVGGLRINSSTDVTFTHGSVRSVLAVDAGRTTVTRSRVDGSGLNFVSTVGVVLSHDTVTDAPVNLSEVADAVITDNALTRSDILIGITDKSTVQHNRISGATSGVFIADTSDHINILDNMFEGNQVGTRVRTRQTDELAGTVISGNTFRHNGAAGVLFDALMPGCTACPQITSNRFVDNGFSPAGLTDHYGNPVADGLHVAVDAGTPVLVKNNVTRHNASYGIFAPPGSVLDGGGNTSAGNPQGCVGVTCTP